MQWKNSMKLGFICVSLIYRREIRNIEEFVNFESGYNTIYAFGQQYILMQNAKLNYYTKTEIYNKISVESEPYFHNPFDGSIEGENHFYAEVSFIKKKLKLCHCLFKIGDTF